MLPFVAPLLFAWVVTPGVILRATPQVRHATPLIACDDAGLSADTKRLQQEVSQAKRVAADASNAEARLRTMVRLANENAQQLADERDAAKVEACDAAELIEDLKAEIEATRELAAQDELALRDELEELRRQCAGSSGAALPDGPGLEREVGRLTQELAIASDRAARAEDEAEDLRAELEATQELSRQDVAVLEEQLDELRRGGGGANASPPSWEEDADEVQSRRVKELEEQVAGLLEVIDGQAVAAAELQVLRPKYAELKQKCRALENER